MKQLTNLEIAELLRKISAAYLVLNENRFKIIAYDRAADSIEHLTSDVKDLWDDGKLGEIPGVGQGIAHYLDELFRTGRVKHFDSVMKRVPAAMFPLLLVPGLGPKKAYRLVTELKLTNEKTVFTDLEKAALTHRVAVMEGFGQKSEEDILVNLATYKRGAIKENRMVLPIADAVASEVIAYIKKSPHVERVDKLGSLRRQVSTVGDIDIAVATTKPQEVTEHFVTYPHQKLVEKGPGGATLLLHNGRQVDMRVQTPEKYGAMLQYFTGSKHHNIKLREYALNVGLSLNEHGIKLLNKEKYQISNIKYQTYISKIKNLKKNEIFPCNSEEEFYGALGFDVIPPELREDRGEIDASLHHTLPHLPEVGDIKGDLHIHSSYDLKSSHDVGVNSISELLDKAERLRYEYIGLSDHNPKISDQSEKQIVEIMKKRQEFYMEKSEKHKVKAFVMCEVDILPDGRLALPDAAFAYVDGVIVSLHSSFTQDKKTVTARIIRALTHHPKVRIMGHPTGRLIGSREGVDADWPEIFEVAKKQNIALEINSYPERLDLPDTLVYDAVKSSLKFTIDTDSHAVDHMDLMRYGVSVARRGWAEKKDILNTMEYNRFKDWLFKIKK